MSKHNDHSSFDPKNRTTQQLLWEMEDQRAQLRYEADEAKSITRKFEIAGNIKENLYAFILQRGLFKELEEYEMNTDMESPEGISKVIKQLRLQLPENSN